MLLSNVLLAAALLLALLAAALDLRSGLIPNGLTAAGALMGLMGQVAAGMVEGWSAAWTGLVYAFVGASSCALLPGILYLARGIGGGDVKLLIALGAIVGVRVGLELQLIAFTLAPLLLFGLLAYEGVLWRTLSMSATTLASMALRRSAHIVAPVELQRTFQFAPLICVGMAISLVMHWGRP